jgi:hypothetical protein
MLSGLIPELQQPGNDIDTYFRSLDEDLKVQCCGTMMECKTGMSTSVSTFRSKPFVYDC